MACLVKLHCSIETTGERQEWAVTGKVERHDSKISAGKRLVLTARSKSA